MWATCFFQKKLVMPGLEPGIHVFTATTEKDVDGRDKPGHDEGRKLGHDAVVMPGLEPGIHVFSKAADYAFG
jgi:hypothetical protein